MSVSTDAILCYGFTVGDEDDEIELPECFRGPDGDVDIEYLVAKLNGISEPGDFDKAAYDSDKAVRDQWKAYWETKRKAVADCGIKLVIHCHHEYPVYVLAVGESFHEASRGSPIKFPGDIRVNPEWRGKLVDFCIKAGITFQEPSYILCSYWG